VNAKALATALALLACCAGCGKPAPPPNPPEAQSAAPPAAHDHQAPHGGLLVEIGEEFAQIELVRDRDSGTLTGYVFDGEAENATRIAQPTLDLVFDAPAALAGKTISLAARRDILTGETVGDTSEFSAVDDAFRGTAPLKGHVAHILVKGGVFENLAFEISR
jgi:predicted small lipoprotein YifL